MLQLKNETPFAPAIAVLPDADGIDTLYVAVKATFALDGRLLVAAQQVPPSAADEYCGEPGASSLRYAADVHLTKPSTDVVLVGHAHAPDGRRTTELDVTLSVAERRKTLRVFGDRTWRGALLRTSISAPQPFTSMPLTYERAYGGTHVIDAGTGKVLAEERNPVGVGFRGKRKAREMRGQPIPNLEDPRRLLRRPGDRVAPAGFGFVAPSWLPRRSYAGTYDAAWQQSRAPYLPRDFDARFFNAAHPDLVFERYLQGDEPVEVENASRAGRLSFTLPRCGFDVAVRIAGRRETPAMNLETVLIEPDLARLCMTWRGHVACDKQVLRVESVTIATRQLAVGGRSL